MTCDDIKWLINSVDIYMTELKTVHKFKTFEITAYSNPDQIKIPIRYQLDDYPVDYIVLDYINRNRIEECEGIYVQTDFIRLMCDQEKLNDTGEIDYYINTILTKAINNKLNK